MNPAERVITLQWVNSQMAGDESLELWTKVAGVWSLAETIPVDSTPEQTHEFTGAPGTAYVFQLRARRDGAYRTDYQSSDPDDWPSTSRLEYTAGLPVGVLALSGWSRTSGISQQLAFTFSNIDPARPVKFYRDDGGGFDLIDTIAAGTSTYAYIIGGGESGSYLNFQFTQEDDDAVAVTSNGINAYAGPAAPTNLTTDPPSAYANIWYGYHVQWTTGQAGAETRLEDDYCGAYTARATNIGAGTEDYLYLGLQKDSAMDPNGNVEVSINVRVRHELTSFAVTDVSDWIEAAIPVDIASDETAYGAC